MCDHSTEYVNLIYNVKKEVNKKIEYRFFQLFNIILKLDSVMHIIELFI